ncbi:MAG: porin [Sandaracinaceae bacterium]|nr:porin [Sandaracinaceae bacterium]
MSQTTYSRALALTLLLTAATAEAQPTPIAPPDDTPESQAVATPIAGPPVNPADVDVSAVEAEEVEAEEAPVDDTGRVTASLGRGVRIESTDGRFMLNIRARAQLLATALSDTDAGGDGSITFQARRARLLFQGHLFGPEWTYYLQLGFSNRDTESDLRLPLRDAYMNWSGLRDMNIRFGQMKVPHDRQRVNSSSALQMVDRSIVTGEFNLDRDVGIQLFSTDVGGLDGRLAYAVGVFGGDGRNRITGDFGLLYVGRVSYLPFGGFEDYVESDHGRAPEPRLALTAGFAYNQNSVRERSTFQGTYQLGSFDFMHANFDAVFKMSGFSLSAQAFMRQARGANVLTDPMDPANTETARVGYGAFVQAGYLFTDNLELVARFGEIRPSRNGVSALGRQGELGGGLNWYFQKHDFKIQLDYFWLYGDGFDEGRHQVRIQSQFFL